MTATLDAPAKALPAELETKLERHAQILNMTTDDYLQMLLENDQWRIDIETKMVEIEAMIVRDQVPEQVAERIRTNHRRTPMDIAMTRARIEAQSQPARRLPPGMTPDDLVKDLWPGDESDEEVEAMIRDLKK